ncbi:phage tail assembly protein [Pseudomonas chlororaphis]|uniref:phage tail assembly protein n=1 Tax=Pseudomonas chlororaphis TaxID=587753 RepID=UPI0009D6B91C|nr:phage tail assembly protein [Pseudomonas chlororaphis]
MAEPISLTLKFPFKSPSAEEISKLPIKRLKRKDISAAQAVAKTEVEMETMLIAKMLGITIEDLGEFDIADSKSATEVLRVMSEGGDLAEVLVKPAVAGVPAVTGVPSETFQDVAGDGESVAVMGRGTVAGAEDAAV